MYQDASKKYLIGIGSSNVGKYRKLGYDCSVGDKLNVTVDNLIEAGSIIKITCICERCSKVFERQARQIKERLASNKYCIKCQNTILFGISEEEKQSRAKAKKDAKELEKYGAVDLTTQEKIKLTCLAKFGAENVYASEYGKQKIRKTNLERYGHSNIWGSEQGKDKIKDTKLERYGSSGYNNIEKTKETNFKNYGVEYSFQMPHVIDVIKEKGAEYFSSEEFKEFRNELRKENRWGEYREDLEDWELYKLSCWVFTNQNDLAAMENYEKRGLAGVEGAYQLDHIISVKYGYENNIDPRIIGNINNIKFISWEDNLRKGTQSHMSLTELTEKIKGDIQCP